MGSRSRSRPGLGISGVSPKGLFGLFATAELITWALLLSALAARALVGLPPELFFVVGALHGFTFLGYAVTATLVAINQRWGIGRMLAAISLAIVPFATVPFDRSLNRGALLEGAWRTEASDHPRDRNPIDRLFRWLIARPLLLVVLLLAFVVALFAFLLYLGPPTEWGR